MVNEIDEKKLMQEVRAMLKGISLGWITRNSTVKEETIQLINRGDDRKISSATLLELCRLFSRKERVCDIVNHFDGEIHTALMTCYSSFMESTPAIEVPRVKLTDSIENDVEYFVFRWSTLFEGVTKNFVKEQLGEIGLEAIDKLVDKEVISINGDKIRAVEDYTILDLNFTKRNAPHLMKFFKPENMHSGSNIYLMDAAHINEDCRKRVLGRLKKAEDENYEDMCQPESRGSIKQLSMVFSDTMTFGQEDKA
ncbi:MAG: hypothetical protein ISR65_14015 [Bacteriovoracaceae bacterium]|nr:hypothetical protein [Bacteriovoracaceae bacterium]